jgi:hypothetical protein
MKPSWLTLQPFRPERGLETIQLQARAVWQQPELDLQLRLRDPQGLVCFPPATALIERRDGLWQFTCFEAFFSAPGAEAYWELNLAPNGHWNAYRLSGYRTGLQPEASLMELPYNLQRRSGELEIRLRLDLHALLPDPTDLDLSITSVLAFEGLGCTYWALHHSGSEPDFHRRDSFLRLQAAA